jgi:hypothetical protein
MSQWFYDGQVKRYLTQFMRLMSSFSYKDAKGNLVTIPVRYGDMTRQVASIINKNSENVIQSAPFIACYIKDLQFDRTRLQDPTFVHKLNIRERAFDENNQEYLNYQGSNYTVERIMPTPYIATFAADIWTTSFDQKLQIFEQLSVLFTPSLEIQTSNNYIDWTSLSVLEIESQTFESRTIPQGLETSISISNYTFKSPIWISPPAKVKKLGIITKIINNIFNEGNGVDDPERIFLDIEGDSKKIITPSGCELLVLEGRAKLLPIKKINIQLTIDQQITENLQNWMSILDLYPGKFQNGLSQLRLLKSNNTEIVAFMSINSENESEMILTYDADTIPENTILSDLTNTYNRGTIDAIIDPTAYNPGTPTVDTRYLILEDINYHPGQTFSGPKAWKNLDNTDFSARANDIIQWDGSKWNIIFNSQLTNDVTYITNLYTGIQYKWEDNQWSKSFEGLYEEGSWRLIL